MNQPTQTETRVPLAELKAALDDRDHWKARAEWAEGTLKAQENAAKKLKELFHPSTKKAGWS